MTTRRVTFDFLAGCPGYDARVIPVTCEVDELGQVELIAGDIHIDDLGDVFDAAREEATYD